MKILGLFSHSSAKKAAKAGEAIVDASRKLYKQNLAGLEGFVQRDMPKIASAHRDSMAALECLSKQAQAAVKMAAKAAKK